MSTQTPNRFNTPRATQSLDVRRQARVVASFAEYLAEYVHGSPDRALEAMASLAEWCDGDPSLLARAGRCAARHPRPALRHRREQSGRRVVAGSRRPRSVAS